MQRNDSAFPKSWQPLTNHYVGIKQEALSTTSALEISIWSLWPYFQGRVGLPKRKILVALPVPKCGQRLYIDLSKALVVLRAPLLCSHIVCGCHDLGNAELFLFMKNSFSHVDCAIKPVGNLHPQNKRVSTKAPSTQIELPKGTTQRPPLPLDHSPVVCPPYEETLSFFMLYCCC